MGDTKDIKVFEIDGKVVYFIPKYRISKPKPIQPKVLFEKKKVVVSFD